MDLIEREAAIEEEREYEPLGEVHRLALQDTLPKLLFVSDEGDNGDEGSDSDDYSANGISTAALQGFESSSTTGDMPTSQLAVFEVLNLSQFEWDVLQAAVLDGERGWQTRIGKQYNYTRRAAGAALNRIRKRLEQTYSDLTGETWEWQQKIA